MNDKRPPRRDGGQERPRSRASDKPRDRQNSRERPEKGPFKPRKPYSGRSETERSDTNAPRSGKPRSGKPFAGKSFPDKRGSGKHASGKPFGGKADRPRRTEAPRREIPERGAERVAKVIARAGLGSRRDVEEWIAAGRVAINDQTIDTPARNVTPADRITVDGKPLPARERTRLFLYNKPRGLVTTHADPEGRPTIFGALPGDLPRLISIGRLDINTEGLLLLTNDGGLARVLELPETGWLRRYRVRANGTVTQADLDKLRDGITIDGIHYGAIEATLDREQGANVWLTFAIREGKNREVKNVLGHLGLTVSRLIRVSFGPFQLGELGDGEIEEVKTRVLREQLGERVIADAGADFSSAIVDREPEAPRAGDRMPRRPARDEASGEHRGERPRRFGGDRGESRDRGERPQRDQRRQDRPRREDGRDEGRPRRFDRPRDESRGERPPRSRFGNERSGDDRPRDERRGGPRDDARPARRFAGGDRDAARGERPFRERSGEKRDADQRGAKRDDRSSPERPWRGKDRDGSPRGAERWDKREGATRDERRPFRRGDKPAAEERPRKPWLKDRDAPKPAPVPGQTELTDRKGRLIAVQRKAARQAEKRAERLGGPELARRAQKRGKRPYHGKRDK